VITHLSIGPPSLPDIRRQPGAGGKATACRAEPHGGAGAARWRTWPGRDQLDL